MLKQKLLAEFLGTFFLVTVVSFTGNPIAIGAVLTALVYSAGHISGAHFNPAVTLAVYLKQKISQSDALAYIVVQLAGGLAAAGVYFFSHRTFFTPQPAAHTSWVIALFIEMFFTFLLVRTILSVAIDSRVKNNQYFGLAIGAALLAGAMAGGPISGGAYNPAVGVMPLLLDFTHVTKHLSLIALYIVGPCLGAAAAALTWSEKK